MSYDASAWVYKVRGLSHTERVVLGYLAFSQNSETGRCNSSVQTIMIRCEMSRAAVFRALKSLDDQGIITIKNRSSNGWRISSDYLLHLNNTNQSQIEPVVSQIDTVVSQIETPLESDLESDSESESEALDQTVSAVDPKSEYSDFEQEVTKPLKLEFKVEGAPLTPEMKTAGVTGVAFQTLDDLINYGPLLGVPVNLDDILHLHQKSLTVEQAISKARNGKKSYTALGLAGLWRDLNIIHNPGVFQKALTLKESGQLAWLGKSLAEIDVGRVMATVFQDWINFGKFLKDQGIVQDFPDKPNIGFFLKHGGMAFEFSKKLSTPAVSGGLKPFDPNE